MAHMSDLLAPLIAIDRAALVLLLARLVLAWVLGLAVAAVYRGARPMNEEAESFTVTLVLLTILIAMVTQVIGDNVARAFSLVGALSIVRFRTVVRDTQDTAYVIFAVAIGMAMGANHPAVALSGLGVVGMAAVLLKKRGGAILPATSQFPFVLRVRLAIGLDADAAIGPTIDQFATGRRLVSLATARQGLAIDASYRTGLRSETSAGALVAALNRLEGVQNVEFQRTEAQEG
jgi:hypothetical protein